MTDLVSQAVVPPSISYRKYRLNRVELVQPEDQSMKYIALNKGLFAIVDVEDYAYLNQWNWTAWKGKRGNFYARRFDSSSGTRRVVSMHSEVMKLPNGMFTDHRDHNTLDNRKCQLRQSTNQQNACNRRMRIDNTSGFKGASFHKLTGRWIAQATVDGTHFHLGLHNSAREAHAVYQAAIKKLHGEFARTE